MVTVDLGAWGGVVASGIAPSGACTDSRMSLRDDIDSQTYLTLTQAVLSKRADLDDRELAARIAEIQLETALFLPPAEARTPQ